MHSTRLNGCVSYALLSSVRANMPKTLTRCSWAGGDDAAMRDYHDREWGVPLHDDTRLFEFIVLEGAQAGLSWSTILRKRESYRAAFRDFDLGRVAKFGSRDIDRLIKDEGIVRN